MKKIYFLLLLTLFCASSSMADSYYSASGLGLVRYYPNARSVGMGGAGIGVREQMALNLLNPAAMDIKGITTLSIDFQFESIDGKNEIAKVNTRDGNAIGFRLVLPIYKTVNFISGITPHTSSRYVLSASEDETEPYYSRKVLGHGGIASGDLGIQYHASDKISIAVLTKFYFGSFNEEWKIDFMSDLYVDGTDEITSHVRGIGFDLGLYARPTTALSVGLVYRSPSKLNMETKTILADVFDTDPVALDLTYPQAIGLGAAYRIQKVTLAADVYTQLWSQYSIENVETEKMNNYYRFGGGFEYNDTTNPFASYFRRIFLRVGAYYAQLPIKTVDGSSVNEQFLSAGLGLPFHQNAGRIDLSFEIGKRGDLETGYFEETIYRLSFSIIGGERWFHRPTR